MKLFCLLTNCAHLFVKHFKVAESELCLSVKTLRKQYIRRFLCVTCVSSNCMLKYFLLGDSRAFKFRFLSHIPGC